MTAPGIEAEGRDRASGLGSREPDPHAKRLTGGALLRQELPNSLFQDGVVQAHCPFQQCLSDCCGQHAVKCQAIQNKRPVGLKARDREVGKHSHIIPKPDPFQGRNENLFLEPGPA